MIRLDLPSPPSVNDTRRSHGPGVRLLDRWHAQADMAVMAAGRLPKAIPGAFEATITFPETSRLDLDNGIKAVIDYARRIELITNDNKKYLRRLVVEFGDVPSGCRLTLAAVQNVSREISVGRTDEGGDIAG